MKSAALLLALLLPAIAGGATVTNHFVQTSGAPYTNEVRFVPLDTPLRVQDGVIALDPPVVVRPTNGWISAELLGGRYRVEFGAGSRAFRILVPPDDTNAYPLTYCAALATNVPGFSLSPDLDRISRRLLPGSHLAAVTNDAGLPSESLVLGIALTNGLTGTAVFYSQDASGAGRVTNTLVLQEGRIIEWTAD